MSAAGFTSLGLQFQYRGVCLEGHPHLALLPLIFLLWVQFGCCVRATIVYHFAGTCWEDKECSNYSYPQLKLNIYLQGHSWCP
jgi:hypothetical protein